jgi:hypothetical protein
LVNRRPIWTEHSVPAPSTLVIFSRAPTVTLLDVQVGPLDIGQEHTLRRMVKSSIMHRAVTWYCNKLYLYKKEVHNIRLPPVYLTSRQSGSWGNTHLTHLQREFLSKLIKTIWSISFLKAISELSSISCLCQASYVYQSPGFPSAPHSPRGKKDGWG